MKTLRLLFPCAVLPLMLVSCVDESQFQAVQTQLTTAEAKVISLKKELAEAGRKLEEAAAPKELQDKIASLEQQLATAKQSTPEILSKEEMLKRWTAAFNPEEYKELFDGKTPIGQLSEINTPAAQPIYTAKATMATLGSGQAMKIIEMDVQAGWDGQWILKKPSELTAAATAQPTMGATQGNTLQGGFQIPPNTKTPPVTPPVTNPTGNPAIPVKGMGKADLYDFGK